MNKIQYMMYCVRNMDFTNMRNVVRDVAAVSRRPRAVIAGDMLWCALRYQAGYHDYQEFDFWHLSRAQRRLMEAWDRMHPVDQWECTRALRIEALQGNPNRFVKKPCLEAGLWRDVPVPVSAPEADPQWQARHAPESGEGAGQAGQGRQESRPRPPAVLRYARMLRSFLGRTLAW